jgi:hypothetical protein
MYKKVIVTKNINDNASVLNDTIREKIKDFMVLNGWTLDTSKSHGCNYCLYKDFSAQNNSTSLNNWTPPTFEYLYSGSGSTFSQNDPNGEFHFSVSKPLHNSRVISIYPFENPSTRFGRIENKGNNFPQGYITSDTEITKLCTQDSAGYTDSGDRYDTDGFFSGLGYLRKDFTTNRWQYASSTSYDTFDRYYKFNGEIRIDDNVEEVSVEMFYFTDTDLQEEFYFVIKTDKMFGRLTVPNNRFYQTVGFVKIPGLPLICSSTVYESSNALTFSTYGYLTQSFKVYTDSNGVKSFLLRFDEDGPYFEMNEISGHESFINPVNMSTTENVSSTFNPRFDAPDTTPDLWLHHTTGNYIPFLRFTYGAGKYGISYTDCDLANRHHPLKIFGTCWCVVPWMKQTVNNIEHTIYGCLLCDNIFSSYEFLYDKSCSSQTGTSLIVPIQKQFQKYMYRLGPRHIKWYNMFYTVPEKVLNPTQDDISLTWKAYPSKRRSIQGYVNFTTQAFDNFVPWIHPVTKREFNGRGRTNQNKYSMNPPVADMFWFTEGDPAQSSTGQSVLSDCQIGAELDASGPEGFAIDNSDYDASNIETIDLDI